MGRGEEGKAREGRGGGGRGKGKEGSSPLTQIPGSVRGSSKAMTSIVARRTHEHCREIWPVTYSNFDIVYVRHVTYNWQDA